MTENKWDKYFITGVRKNIEVPSFRLAKPGEPLITDRGRRAEHLIWLDDKVIPDSRIYAEVLWLWPRTAGKTSSENVSPAQTSVEPHTHPYDEAICFFGTDVQDPHNLNGEIEFWMDGEQHILDKSFIAFVPAGMKHCPLLVRRVDKPMIHFTIGPSNKYAGSPAPSDAQKKSKKTDKFIVTKLQHPKVEGEWSPPPTEAKNGHGGRILFLDNDVVPGSFYVETVWVTPRPPGSKIPEIPPGKEFEMSPIKPHKHDYDEVLNFYGSNPDDVHDLGGEVWFWIENEKHVITKSTMVYVPAGVMHCPLMYPKVNRPMFHFTSFPGGKTYVEDEKKSKK